MGKSQMADVHEQLCIWGVPRLMMGDELIHDGTSIKICFFCILLLQSSAHSK